MAGLWPKLSDAELVTLAVMQALLGFPRSPLAVRYAGAQPAAPDSSPASVARSQQAAARCRLADPALHPRSGTHELTHPTGLARGRQGHCAAGKHIGEVVQEPHYHHGGPTAARVPVGPASG